VHHHLMCIFAACALVKLLPAYLLLVLQYCCTITKPPAYVAAPVAHVRCPPPAVAGCSSRSLVSSAVSLSLASAGPHIVVHASYQVLAAYDALMVAVNTPALQCCAAHVIDNHRPTNPRRCMHAHPVSASSVMCLMAMVGGAGFFFNRLAECQLQVLATLTTANQLHAQHSGMA
jgi:hypothetical protein